MARDFPYAPLSTATEETSVPQQVQKLSTWVDNYLQDTWGFFSKESRLTWAKAQVSDWGKAVEAAMPNPPENITDAIFAPKKNGLDEDDGYLMLFVYHDNTKSSEFLILDAKNITSDPLASVALPRRVPNGLHGSWIDTKNDC